MQDIYCERNFEKITFFFQIYILIGIWHLFINSNLGISKMVQINVFFNDLLHILNKTTTKLISSLARIFRFHLPSCIVAQFVTWWITIGTFSSNRGNKSIWRYCCTWCLNDCLCVTHEVGLYTYKCLTFNAYKLLYYMECIA